MAVKNAVYSFPPIAKTNARILILGTMPGKRSLAERQYYAHPRNTFWRIAGTLFGFDPNESYRRRTAALANASVALWDVLAACRRPSSLDSDIIRSSIVPNPIGPFLDTHTKIQAIYFNGGNAERLFLRYVHVELDVHQQAIPRIRLPSTSPAHASLDFAGKLQAWKRLLDTL